MLPKERFNAGVSLRLSTCLVKLFRPTNIKVIERYIMFRKFYKGLVLAFLAVLSGFTVASSLEHSPRLQAIMGYQIGGGYLPDKPTNEMAIPTLQLGSGWDVNINLNKFDPRIAVGNQLSGLTEGIHEMLGSIIEAATGDVVALAGMAIQRANPGLYDMLQQGVVQGRMDFEAAEKSFEETAQSLMDDASLPFQKYAKAIKSQNLSKAIEDLSGSKIGDAIQARLDFKDMDHFNGGAEWVCGDKKGGSGLMEPIKAIEDVVEVGYNIMFDRTACETGAVDAATGVGTPLYSYWTSPAQASAWSKRVLGDIEIRTCDGCKKLSGTLGKGLTYLHRDMADGIQTGLEDLVTGATDLTYANLEAVSAPPGVMINDTIIMAIRKRNAAGRAEMISKLAGEVAYTRLVEQGRLLTQLLRTGSKEPNVASMEPAKQAINEAIDQLKSELDLLHREVNVRESIAQKTLLTIMGMEEKAIQSTKVFDRTGPMRSPNL